jgi:uncharacterized membrane protein
MNQNQIYQGLFLAFVAVVLAFFAGAGRGNFKYKNFLRLQLKFGLFCAVIWCSVLAVLLLLELITGQKFSWGLAGILVLSLLVVAFYIKRIKRLREVP